MSTAARRIVEELLAARDAGATGDVRGLLGPDVTYWDCLRGELRGRDAVAVALTETPVGGVRPRFALQTLAAADAHAVVELTVTAAAPAATYGATEVYGLDAGSVVRCRAYLDPAELQAAEAIRPE
jgi:ketosteroid isomerase-like protein